MSRRSLIAIVVLFLFYLPEAQQAAQAQTVSFQVLGPTSTDTCSNAASLSADGQVVVGFSGCGGPSKTGPTKAVRWRNGGQAEVLQFLGIDPNVSSQVLAANQDGSVIVGGSGGQAVRWVNGGTPTGLGYLPGGHDSVAVGTSSDGAVVVGYGSSGAGEQAYRWVNGAMTGLGQLPGGNFSVTSGVNADGTVVVGYSNLGVSLEAIRWVNGGPPVGLGFLNVGGNSSAFGVNADGTVVVGHGCVSNTSSACQAFRWVKDGSGSPSGGTMVPLGLLNGGVYSAASAVNSDGSVVVGFANSTPDPINEPFRWTPSTGMQSIRALLTQAGVNLTGLTLRTANAVSADGSVIVGTLVDSTENQKGWVGRFSQTCSPPQKRPAAPDWLVAQVKGAYANVSVSDIKTIAQMAGCAQLANAAYSVHDANGAGVVAPDGWQLVDPKIKIDRGMHAAVFQNMATSEVVVAFRGTIFTAPVDLYTDAGLCAGTNIDIFLPEMQAALSFAEAMKQQYGVVTVTGHSLGGAMAQYAGVTLGLPAVAFDPMPLAGSYIATQLGRSSISLVYPAEYTPIENQLAGYPNITNFIGPRDPVNGIVDHLCGGAVGTVVASNVGKSPIIISNIPSDPRLIRLFPELLINRFFYNHDMNNIVLAMLTVQLAAPQLLGK